MKILSRINTWSAGWLMALFVTLCFADVYGQRTHTRVNPLDLDYGSNIAQPQVPPKQSLAIQTHMGSIRDAISRIGFNTELRRDNEVVTVIIPCSELFAPNDTIVKGSGKSRLQHFAKLLQYPTMYKIIVAVYSDDTGEPVYCDNLTSARANAVESVLSFVAEQIGTHNVNVVPYGMGQVDPVAENNTIDNRALNRRVEITIVPEWEMIETAKANKLNR